MFDRSGKPHLFVKTKRAIAISDLVTVTVQVVIVLVMTVVVTVATVVCYCRPPEATQSSYPTTRSALLHGKLETVAILARFAVAHRHGRTSQQSLMFCLNIEKGLTVS